MGITFSRNNTIGSIMLENYILPKNIFETIIQNKNTRLELHNYYKSINSDLRMNRLRNTNIKVYICDDSDNTNKYYIALFTMNFFEPPSIAHIIWYNQVYHEFCSYGFDIYSCDKNDKNDMKLIIQNYNIVNPNTRPVYNMSYDFITNFNIIKTLNSDIIKNKIQQHSVRWFDQSQHQKLARNNNMQ